MAFVSYAQADDVDVYVPGITAQLWDNEAQDIEDSLKRAARKINEWLRGLDRFKDSTIPVAEEGDGEYAEILIELNVYMAIWQVVSGTMAGEAFEDHWNWVAAKIRDIKTGIRKGEYSFSAEPGKASGGSPSVTLQRVTV